MPGFAATRLTTARQRRMLSKKDLAEAVGVSPAVVTAYEKGTKAPSADTTSKISEVLRVPVDFFYAGEVELMQPDHSGFRALKSMSARVRDRVYATGVYAKAIVSPYLDATFLLPESRIPDLSALRDAPGQAGEALRCEWNLGHSAIPNMVHLLEAKGVRIFWICESPTRPTLMDALSFWHCGTPFVIANSAASGERQRFSLAHELGHLCMHRDMLIDDEANEKGASEFAASLLLPAGSLPHSFRAGSSTTELFSSLFAAKQHWGASVAFILRRASELSLITGYRYERACRELSRRGWRQGEPRPLPPEESRLHEKVFAKLAETGIGPADVAGTLRMDLIDLVELMPASRKFLDEPLIPPVGPARLRLLS